jgi:hypothetical protein
MTRAAPTAIAVAIEVPHGPIVEALLEHGVGYTFLPGTAPVYDELLQAAL